MLENAPRSVLPLYSGRLCKYDCGIPIMQCTLKNISTAATCKAYPKCVCQFTVHVFQIGDAVVAALLETTLSKPQ